MLKLTVFCEFFLIFVPMKKIFLLPVLLCATYFNAQFTIEVTAPDSFSKQPVVVYTLNGSKDVLATQAQKKDGKWVLNYSQPYRGMLKLYFPDNKQTVNFISENKNVVIGLQTENNTITEVLFKDEANQSMKKFMTVAQKKESVLPALVQIKNLYNDNSTFDHALENEIQRLQKPLTTLSNNDNFVFLNYYINNLKYAESSDTHQFKTEDYIKFLSSTNELLETSSLLKPILINFLRSTNKAQVSLNVDQLLEQVNVESPRGQNILAELLDIFETYGLEDEKNKYFKLASNLKCTINKNLSESLSSIKNTMVGSVFPDQVFSKSVSNSKYKRLSDIKTDKKIILFWFSKCPHCMTVLPKIQQHYEQLKNNGVEVIALSLDSDKESYENTIASLPWINDTELNGWNSSYVTKYNVHATPTFFVLDKNNKIVYKPNSFEEVLSNLNLK